MKISSASAPPLRRDAQARRERLISAAVEVFSEDGFDAPLDRVAERAGVGRATLYRNFPDRAALSIAVLQTYLDALSAKVAESDGDDAFFVGIRTIAELAINSNGFQKIVAIHLQAPTYTHSVRLGFENILAEPLARAKSAGLIRSDFAMEDMHLLSLMVAAGGLEHVNGDTAAGMERAVGLLKRGLSPRPATPEPGSTV